MTDPIFSSNSNTEEPTNNSENKSVTYNGRKVKEQKSVGVVLWWLATTIAGSLIGWGVSKTMDKATDNKKDEEKPSNYKRPPDMI